MARIAFGIILVAMAWVLVAGTNRAAPAVQQGVFHSDPTPAPTIPGASPFRFHYP